MLTLGFSTSCEKRGNKVKRGNGVSFEIALGILLIKSKKRKGPKIDPCGIPDVIGRKSDDSLSVTTLESDGAKTE